MTDDKPDLTTTEVRQGNSRKTNLRVLVFGIIGVVIAFALAVWYFGATQDDTDTTIGGGTTLEDVPALDGSPDVNLDDSAMPVPAEEPDPVPQTPADIDTPDTAPAPAGQ